MPDRPTLLAAGQVSDEMRVRLLAKFDILDLPNQEQRSEFFAQNGAKIQAIAGSHILIDSNMMDQMPDLKVVANFGVGYDTVDAVEAANRGILVSHTPEVLNDEVADTAIMLWLATSKRLISADAWARSGKWASEGDFPLAHSIRQKTLGILGMGRIGQAIAKLAQAFEADILYHTRSPKNVPFAYCEDLISMAEKADAMIVITPGGDATRHLVDQNVMKALGPNGILINISRGTVVDELALVDCLQSGALGAAGLDVFEYEPNIPDALKVMENVVLAPHIGSGTVETRWAMGDLVCKNLEQWAQDGTVVTPVPECRHLIR